MNDYYWILKGRTPVPAKDSEQWGKWFEMANRHVGDTTIEGVRVSTVFMGINYSWGGGPPLLFETMIFGEGPGGRTYERYSTWAEARRGHGRAVAQVWEKWKESNAQENSGHR